ncbi:MAG: hypothetical protein Q4D58_08475 [Synergistaceae bacterium]|nr:hypothetical protein [Synergistaceae bacterium]
MKRLAIALLLTAASAASAVPALQQPFMKRQPDGAIIKIVRRGDERVHWYESANGAYALLFDAKTKWWYFATAKKDRLVSLGVPYREETPAPAEAAKNYRPPAPESFPPLPKKTN